MTSKDFPQIVGRRSRLDAQSDWTDSGSFELPSWSEII